MTTPVDHQEELVELLRDTLRELTGREPEEYGPGRFQLELDDLAISVLATEETFPAIRFHHHVLDVTESKRSIVIDFANALHGRSSTLGATWWLGDEHLWQIGLLWASSFDERIFAEHLWKFVDVARARTPEIQARFDGDWPE